MKCDAGIHEEPCTCVVLSGDTMMFQSFGERVPNILAVSALYTMQIEENCPPERKCSVWVWFGGASPFHSRWQKPPWEHHLDIFRLSGGRVSRGECFMDFFFADMGSGLAKHLGTKYDAAVKDVSVRTQAAKLGQPCTP